MTEKRIIDTDKHYCFMPGCSLASYSSKLVEETADHLRSRLPNFSVIQKCCGKPTLDMGQKDKFMKRFSILKDEILKSETEIMITACQNCYETLKNEIDFETLSLWEVFPELGLPEGTEAKGLKSPVKFTIHDSCPTRDNGAIHKGIRRIMDILGYCYTESPDSGKKTRCCGAGGMVIPANPEISEKVTKRRVSSLAKTDIITYCASCRSNMLKGGAESWHILDLIFGPVVKDGYSPENVLDSTFRSWRNRYRSKKKLTRL